MSEAIVGLPAAAASRATIPNDSGRIEGATLNSERRSASITSGCGNGPSATTPGTLGDPVEQAAADQDQRRRSLQAGVGLDQAAAPPCPR